MDVFIPVPVSTLVHCLGHLISIEILIYQDIFVIEHNLMPGGDDPNKGPAKNFHDASREELHNPIPITIDTTDRVYVSDCNHHVSVFTSDHLIR